MKRAYEAVLREYLRVFPAVAIIGPRQCGKTTLLGTLPSSWKRFDLERASDQQIVANDPELFLRLNPHRVAVDEAQLLPGLFPALRVAIDARRQQNGRFVITGSSSPDLLRSTSETLAGRIGIIEMAPLAWSEVHASHGSGPSFAALLTDRKTKPRDFEALKPHGDLKAVHNYWFRGGYPEPWVKGTERFRSLWMDQYTRTYLMRDVARLFPGLDHDKFRLFLQMLGGLSGSVINYSDVSRALGVSAPTVRDYFEIAHGTFIWRRIPAYEKNAIKRVVKHPKGHLRDSGLLHYLLRLPDVESLLGHPQVGRSWEGMVTEEILRQLTCQGTGFDYYYYRTAAGAEVDLVLEGDFGLIAVEIKHAQAVSGHELRPLREFVKEYKCRLGLVINNDQTPRLYDENVVGLPFACL
jgi:predicted AAA+ superfamily ATPase